MAGPILEAIKSRMSDDDEDLSDAILQDSPLVEDYQDELGRRVPNGGGCCGAAQVAQSIRREQRYD